MKKRAQSRDPKIVFEQPYGMHNPALAKLLGDSDAPKQQSEVSQEGRSQDPNE